MATKRKLLVVLNVVVGVVTLCQFVAWTDSVGRAHETPSDRQARQRQEREWQEDLAREQDARRTGQIQQFQEQLRQQENARPGSDSYATEQDYQERVAAMKARDGHENELGWLAP